MITEKIILDLNDSRRSPVSLTPSLNITFPYQKFDNAIMGKLISRLKMRKIEKKIKIGIRNIKCSDEIVRKKRTALKDMLSIVIDGEKYNVGVKPIEINLTKELSSFHIFFDPAYIIDCDLRQKNGQDIDIFELSGQIYIQNEEGEILTTENFIFQIELKQLQADVKVELATKRRLKYELLPSDKKVNIGQLLITNKTQFKRSPAINFEGIISLLDKQGNMLPAIISPDGNTTPRIYFESTGNQYISNKNIICQKEIIDGEVDFKPLSDEIIINLSGIANPLDACETFIIRIQGQWTYEGQPDMPSHIVDSKEFRLMKDEQGTELRIAVNENPATSDKVIRLGDFEFTPGGQFRDRIEVALSNLATDASRGGLLRIYPPRLITSIPRENTTLYNSRGRRLEPSKIVILEGDFFDQVEDRGFIDIPNGKSAPQIIELLYDPAEIFSLNDGRQYNFPLNLVLEIDYQENSDNRDWNNVELKTFRILLDRQMIMKPFPEWLCVDYGSSAIVSSYKNELLNLNARRKEIFSNIRNGENIEHEWDLNAPKNGVDSERNTLFISSDLLLNAISSNKENEFSEICGEQSQEELRYDKTAVCLAPTNLVSTRNITRLLPCLKLLVGHKYLPDNPDYNKFIYSRKDIEGRISKISIKDSIENDEENSLGLINNLFDEAYKIVFRHYLVALIPHVERVNRLVLTYPNSYTPDHLKVLKEIAADTFRYLREGQLLFVSESDAVAAYYMEHWSDYNSGKAMERPENILVFDMGAGTLDLTFLTKRYEREMDKYYLTIEGKIGIGKAGNYLDYILASIFAEKGSTNEFRNLATTERPSGANADRIARGRLDLKDFIKNKVKPSLKKEKKNESFSFEYLGEVVTLSVREILEHPKYKNFLKEVTKGVLNNMKIYMGQDIKIDTVIMSGRSVRLEALQESLGDAIAQFSSHHGGRGRQIDLDSAGAERQKSAVVEGAVRLAGSYNSSTSKVIVNSRRLYASYGVAFKRLGGAIDYVELASYKSMPLSSDPGSKEFDEVVIPNMTHTDEVRLIQTFLSPAKTLEAIRQNKFDYISEMNTFSLSTFQGRGNLKMKIKIDRHNSISLLVDGRQSAGAPPKGIDLNDEITRRSIWPATI